MRFHGLRLQDFRNFAFAALDLAPGANFLVGPNAAGKSNLLEALSLVSALRSFRTTKMGSLVRKEGAGEFAAVYRLAHEREGEVALEIGWGPRGRRVLIDGEPVAGLGGILGRFPVVPLSSMDLLLLRGGPAERRRFLDATFSSTDPVYYEALRNYHRGISERNRLLKTGAAGREFDAFEAEIAPAAVTLAAKRESGLEKIRDILEEVYGAIAEDAEQLRLHYRPGMSCGDAGEVRRMLCENRRRDALMGFTQKGPHRDEWVFSLGPGGAREYGSDGQQRGLCLALRLAQGRLFAEALGVAPVLLADDVLGELDPARKDGFWRACPENWQIVASGTEVPPHGNNRGRAWTVRRVEAGRIVESG